MPKHASGAQFQGCPEGFASHTIVTQSGEVALLLMVQCAVLAQSCEVVPYMHVFALHSSSQLQFWFETVAHHAACRA